ncbi:MAG TPA: hypothetical protein VD968_07015, partial [Pyrinomonadaceae bacterium]|nr:hypothetical protein [Pyrinomonadaceae bacterium]
VTRSRFAARLQVAEAEVLGSGYGQPPPPKPDASPAPTYPDEGEDDEVFWEDEEEPPPPPAPAARTGPGSEPPPAAAPYEPQAPVVHLLDGRHGPGALLVDYAYGRGRVVVLSDPYIVSNGGINRADNLILATNVVTSGGGPIAFDEYHQGYGGARNELFSYFAGTPILWMFAQAGVIVLAVVWTRGRRFARPLPAPRVDRRSKLEFVASMAELQQRARAYDLAVENIYARTRRALARYAGAAPDARPEQLAARVAARSGRDPRPIEELLRECEAAAQGQPLSPRRALALARGLRELERDLGILMRSREIRQAEAR